jgi:hypothetical protein
MPGLNPFVRFAVLGLAFTALSCGKTTSPTTPTDTPADPTVTERFVGTIGVGGAGFYSFTVPRYGTVNVVLNTLSGVDGDVQMAVGVGVPIGFGCSTGTNQTGAPGLTLSAPYQPGIYCARVSDAGNLTGSTRFDVSIAHP